MACPSSMASERKPPELTPSTTFDNISATDGAELRYMHLSPAAIEGAIRLLVGAGLYPTGGEIAEAENRGSTSAAKRTR